MALSFELRTLQLSDKKLFWDSLPLWSSEDLDWYSFILDDNPSVEFEEMIQILHDEQLAINLKPGRVAHTMLYAFYNNNGETKIIGRISVRHSLNDYLLKRGGHIGYAVCSKYRGQGVATEMLKQSLQYCKAQLNLDKVLITCADSNTPSIKLIEAVGGVLEDKPFDEGHSEIIRRYWVSLT